jgi:Fe-coproporphyrin III synthase
MRSDLKDSTAANVEEENGEERNRRLSSLPILLLNVHESCNCRCLMCDIWQRKDTKELNLADFTRHRESLLRFGVRQVVLTGGEPLLHRNFEELCAFLAECGVHVTLLTTGLLLSKRADVVAEGVDEIIVSLDGPEEIHDRVRRVKGAYHLILEGIQAVREKKAEMPVHGRSTVQKANHSLLRQTVAAAKTLSLDSISFLAADVTSQAFNRELVWPGERQNQIVLTGHEVEALENEIASLIRENAGDIRSRYILESEAKLNRIARRFREHLRGRIPMAPTCNAPWVSAVMEVNGDVRPCFFHGSVGNTREKTLEQVINGREALKFRSTLSVAENAICRRCVCSLNYDPSLRASLEPAQTYSSTNHSHSKTASFP